MPSAVRTTSSRATAPKNRLKTALGFLSSASDSDSSDTDTPTNTRRPAFGRRSIDTARNVGRRQKGLQNNRVSSFLHHEPTARRVPQEHHSRTIDSVLNGNMTAETAPPARRAAMRVDHDGPWSVSVAETPHDSRSYSLYIKTPTHNLTLTRTVKELVELDRRLRDEAPDANISAFPIDVQSLPSSTPKRKSNFLNTLSRLASPTSTKTFRNTSSGRFFSNSQLPTTPLSSPSCDIGDPFIDAVPITPSTNSTALATYLTAISNTPGLREVRVWKRFVRVRTDDLESVRVERAIKKVRSDLAAHLRDSSYEGSIRARPSENGSINDGTVHGDDVHEALDDTSSVKDDPETSATDVTESPVTGDATDDGANDDTKEPDAEVTATVETAEPDEAPSTPTAPDAPNSASRIQRSHSADFDRISRAFESATSSPYGPSSHTGDESSASTTGEGRRISKRKKRSKSMAPKEPRKSQRKVAIDDFEMMRVLGKGCAGKVLLVRHKATTELYALKAITKRHVLAHQELQHTLTEQAVLKRMAAESKDPFVVKLWWSFHDKENLFLVMDFHPGGDLATQLARWGRLGRDRARFYAAEIVEGCEGLHAAGVIYRDLKPENILIGADGHIVLTDFGLSKEFPRRSVHHTAPSTPLGNHSGDFYSSMSGLSQPVVPPWMVPDASGEVALGWPGPTHPRDHTTTFCGTAEYLAPEVIQGHPYSYEIDWWSFGTMLYEMLTGITPFWADNHADMYVRVLQDELAFPEDRSLDQDTRSLIRGLLQRDPALRICEPRIKRHPYFSMIDWSHVYYKRYIPPYIPPIDPSNASDTQNFDDTFLDMEPVLDDPNDEQLETDQEPEQTDTDRTDGEESNTTPSQSRSSSIRPAPLQNTVDIDDSVDVFDGYSFKGRHSVVMDDEEEDGSEEGSGEEEDENEDGADESLKSEEDGTPAVTDENVREATSVEQSEPKTPEARPAALPEEQVETVVESKLEEKPALPPKEVSAPKQPPPAPEAEDEQPRKSKDLPRPITAEPAPPAIPEKDVKSTAVVTLHSKIPAPKTVANRNARPRKEKSGVPALDRYLSDVDTDIGATEREYDTEDDDWDFVEAGDGEDRNGTQGGTSLFARGVVDRYKLAVFRKASTPSHRSVPRSLSTASKVSGTNASFMDSPSPGQKRGRTPLAFRKNRQFLAKPPPSSFSSRSSTAKSFSSNTNIVSGTSSSGMLTSASHGSRSLRSKESTLSVGGRSQSSDQSGNGELGHAEVLGRSGTYKSSPPLGEEKPRAKKLKKYKENAEKVFSLFSSPR